MSKDWLGYPAAESSKGEVKSGATETLKTLDRPSRVLSCPDFNYYGRISRA